MLVSMFTVPGTFSFGNLSAPDSTTTSTDTKKEDPASKPFVFAPLSTSSTKANTGFNFTMATGVDQKGIIGAPSGDMAVVTSTEVERKSPVGVEPKTGGAAGFGFGEAAGLMCKMHIKSTNL